MEVLFLDEAKRLIADLDARARKPNGNAHLAITARELLAEVHFRAGRRDEMIGAWQEILDTYPTSPQFKRFEELIKKETGLLRNPQREDLYGFDAAAEECDDMGIRKGLDEAIAYRMHAAGLRALDDVVKQVESRCAKERVMTYVYSHAALVGAAHKRCEVFERFIGSYLRAGGSPTDAEGYRRNYPCAAAPH